MRRRLPVATFAVALAALAALGISSAPPSHGATSATTAQRADQQFSATIIRVDYDEAEVAFTGRVGWLVSTPIPTPAGVDDRIGPDGTVTISYPTDDYEIYQGFAAATDPTDPTRYESTSFFLDADLTSPKTPVITSVTAGAAPGTVTVTATARVAGFVQIYDGAGRLRGSALVPTEGAGPGNPPDNDVSVTVDTIGGEKLNARYRYGAFLSPTTTVEVGAVAGAVGTTPPRASAETVGERATIRVDGVAGGTATVHDAFGNAVARASLPTGHASVPFKAPAARAVYRVTQTTGSATSAPAEVTVHPELAPGGLAAPVVAYDYDRATDRYLFTITAMPGAVVRLTPANREASQVVKIAGASGRVQVSVKRPSHGGLIDVTQQIDAIVSPATAAYL